ncbi:MAG: SlyX family protein [Dokdonella sp.]
MSSLEERLTELEVRLAFIDDGVASLNAAVAMQDQMMLGMRRELDRLRGDLVGLRSTLGNDVNDEPPPPHY